MTARTVIILHYNKGIEVYSVIFHTKTCPKGRVEEDIFEMYPRYRCIYEGLYLLYLSDTWIQIL